MTRKYTLKFQNSKIPIGVPCPSNQRIQSPYPFISFNESPSTSSDKTNRISRDKMRIFVEKLKTLRWVTLILGLLNLGVIFLGGFLMVSGFMDCGGENMLCVAVIMLVACIRIMSMIGTAIAQESTARMIVNEQRNDSSIIVDAVIRHERRMRYKRWLWWTRFGTIITISQFVGATYLMFIMVKYVSYDGKSSGCFLGLDTNGKGWKRNLAVLFLVLVWLLVVVQCFTGSDVLRWRSFYETHDNAWKSHYREVFDNGIREALCCLGRVKYLSVLEEDEVYSVARLLGDLVAYRASGTGHLELLAGLALLQTHRRSTNSYEGFMEAPEALIREAATYHQFAEAAYTGPLLDFGRNPVLFPCVWLYRQGIFTPWTRNRRPILEGDNWWRGHAAAFLKYVDLFPEALRQGRVRQEKCEAAYFIVVLHHERSVVIAVRGTETPEDLITDGLCRECALSMEDLDGLINSDHVAADVKHSVISSFPHYGHSGIVEAARELFIQIDGQPGDKDSRSETGYLSSLLGEGCECHGYIVRIVGHSLGGSVGALLGLRLYQRYPNLHVYSYGTLPCVDSVIGEACSEFVTSIVYNDEFSARLSVSSILRLRAAAITALSHDSSTDSAMICKLARRILNVNKCNNSGQNERISTASFQSGTVSAEDNNHHMYRRKNYAGGGEPSQEFLFQDASFFTENPDTGIMKDGFSTYSEIPNSGFGEFNLLDSLNNCNQPDFYRGTGIISCGDPVSQFTDGAALSNKVPIRDPPELFLPGLIIHIVPEQRRSFLPLWISWNVPDRERNYRAFVANKESFKDIIVSPFMFLDHLPWRCHDAMQRVLESRKEQDVQLYESHMV